MVLLVPSWSCLQILIEKLHQEALAINMTFNVSKTVCMIFKPVNSRYAICHIFPKFYASGQILSIVTQFKYLGHIICNDLCDDEDIKREIKALFTRCNVYFLVDLRDVRVLSRYDYIRRRPTARVFLVQHCGLHLGYISDSTTVYIVF